MRTPHAEDGNCVAVMPYEEHVIDSWSTFVNVVLSRRYANWAFRGHADARWPLRALWPTIHDCACAREGLGQQESRILRIFKRKAHLFLTIFPTTTIRFAGWR